MNKNSTNIRRPLPSLVVLFCVLLTWVHDTRAQQPARPIEPRSRTLALVVGISKYARLPGGFQLQFADRDAELFVAALQKAGVERNNIRLLAGAAATSSSIKSALGNWLSSSAAESDTVVIFFSGHGLVESGFGEGYLLGYDSDPKDPYTTAISLGDLRNLLTRRLRSRNVFLITDSIRRDLFGDDPEQSRLFARSFEELAASREGVSVILASGPGEFSREGQRWGGYGVFTKYITEALGGAADADGDGAIQFGELFDFVANQVTNDTANKQHPWRNHSTASRTELAKLIDTPNRPLPRALRNHPSPTPAIGVSNVPNKRPTESAAIPAAPTLEARREDHPAPSSDASKNRSLDGPSSNAGNAVPERAVIQQQPPAEVLTSENTDTTGRDSKVSTPKSEVRDRPSSVTSSPRQSETSSKSNSAAMKNRSDNPSLPTASSKTRALPSGVKTKATGRQSQRQPAKPTVAGRGRNTSSKTGPSTSSRVATESPKNTRSAPRSRSAATIASAGKPGSSEVGTTLPSPPNRTVIAPPAIATLPTGPLPAEPPLDRSIPVLSPGLSPSPLVLEIQAAISSGNLIQPANTSAWDYFHRFSREEPYSDQVPRLRQLLAAALIEAGKAIVAGDLRADNISNKVDEFRRAGQMFIKARGLLPEASSTVQLEKLTAVQALVALQFYEEAEKALSQLQSYKVAAVENTLGISYLGSLNEWQAERAFKRAIELDPSWASPHYNLALLYRNRQGETALAEFEKAAELDPSNASLFLALGDECFRKQHWAKAVSAYRKAIGLSKPDETLHTKLGHALYSQGLRDEANREYERARELRGRQQ